METIDKLVLILSLCYSIWFYCFAVFTPFLKIKKRTALHLFILFCIALALIAALVEPKDGFDLTRHYNELEIIRANKMSFVEFIFHSDKITTSNYKYMFAFNAMRYIIAIFFENGTLPFVTVLISSLILSYILFDSNKGLEIYNYRIAGTLGMFFALMHFLFLYSGIRNGLAMSIAALGIYFLYFKERILVCFILMLVAITIHPVSLIVVPVIILSYIRPYVWYAPITVFVLPIMKFGAALLVSSEIGFFKMVGKKYYNYMYVYNDIFSGWSFTVATLTINLIIVAAAFLLYKYHRKSNSFYTNFIIWYVWINLCFVSNQQFFMRLSYFTAFLSPLLIDWVVQENDIQTKTTAPVMCYCLIVFLGAYMCYKSAQWML